MTRKRLAYVIVVASILLALVGLRSWKRTRSRGAAELRGRPLPFVASDALLDDSYMCLDTLDDARSLAHTAVVMRGGDGTSLYLTAPTKYVVCDASTLRGLLVALDALELNDAARASLTFELAPIGGGVRAGSDVGYVEDGVWIRPQLANVGILPLVTDVIEGRRTLDDAIERFPNALLPPPDAR